MKTCCIGSETRGERDEGVMLGSVVGNGGEGNAGSGGDWPGGFDRVLDSCGRCFCPTARGYQTVYNVLFHLQVRECCESDSFALALHRVVYCWCFWFLRSMMNQPMKRTIVSFCACVGLCLGVQAQPQMTEADFNRVLKEISNWGRWGAEDQLGALNLITPATRKAAAQLVVEGISVSMARTPETQRAADNPQPFDHTMLAYGLGSKGMYAADHFAVAYHGFAHTHMDSLCHFFYNDQVYNGYSRDQVTEKGALKLGIENVKNGIVARGVLMDIPRLRGKRYLEPGEAIYPADLDAWEKEAGFRVRSGDVLLIRTGRWTRRAEKGPWPVSDGMPGLHGSCGKWLKERDIAILGSDGASDVMPSQVPGINQPIHLFALHALGVHILDNCDFEAVAETAAKLNRWEFMLTTSPIPVKGGTGSPLNPIATF